jgi:hypothetical protein
LPQTGLPNRNYQYLQKVPVDKDQFTGRIDFNESAVSQWFGRYSWTDELTITPGVQLNGTILYTKASQWVLSNTRVLSSAKVNEFRFGYNSLFNNISQELSGVENVNEKLGTPVKRATGDARQDAEERSLSEDGRCRSNDSYSPHRHWCCEARP